VGVAVAMLASSSSSQKGFAPSSQPSQSLKQTDQAPTIGRTSIDRDGTGLQIPNGGASRNLSASAVSFAARGSSLNPGAGPGSFSSELRSQMIPIRSVSRTDAGPVYPSSFVDKVDDGEVVEQNLSMLRDKLNREMKIKEGSENMLEALNLKKAKQTAKQTKEQRQRVEAELTASHSRIKILKQQITDAQLTKVATPSTPPRSRAQQDAALHRSPHSVRSVTGSDVEEPTESPTFTLAELLQALEVGGMTPDYYVTRANLLVDLFKRYPTLKYDLVWSVFGLRMQMMLLSESREVVAAGYRATRYAISDRNSLKKIRSLNTDFLVVR
jgi:hypothetical protein